MTSPSVLGRSSVAPERGPAAGRRPRVLWLIKGLGAGGAERLLALSAEVRDRDAFDYEVAYLLPWKTALVEEFRRAGVPVHCLAGGREWDLRWAVRLRRLVRSRGIDVVHVHSPYVAGVARLAIRSLPAAVRPRVVSTEHLPWSGHARATRALNALTYGLDDAHLVVSRAVLASIPARRASGVVVLHQGIVAANVRRHAGTRDEVRRELGVGPDEVLVVTTANFTAQKGYPHLFEAARRLLGRGLPVRFAVMGQGPREREIRALHGELGLGDGVLLLGYRSDVPRVLTAADVFVLASVNEGLPVAVMEALAAGLPVVATAVGGVPEAVEDGVEGRLVPPARADLLADALEPLVLDPELRARMARAATERSRSFDIQRAVRWTEALYRELLR